jgi:hypothetical protein
LSGARSAITQTVGVIIILVIVVAAGAGGYLLTMGHSPSNSNSSTIVLSIVESDPVNQVDSFNPANLTATHGTTVTLAVQNGDDEPRTFELSAFNVNQTIGSGDTIRVTFTVGQAGAFEMFVPATPPSQVNGVKASPSITGYLIVT